MPITETTCRCGPLAAAAAAVAISFGAHAQAMPPAPPYLAQFPEFASKLAPAFPGDVDTALQKQLEGQKRFSEVQRLFDLNAWQMFLAVNWPTNDQSQPAPSITDTGFGEPHWTLWQTSPQIYRTDGRRPPACGSPAGPASALLALPQAPLLRGLSVMQRPPNTNPRSSLQLANLSAVGNTSILNLKAGETDQAFTGPLIDQNGNYVHYDIALDPNEVDYICRTGIYSVNGQVAFSNGKQNAALSFPAGVDTQDWSGATEVKFAWKVLAKADQADRFFNMHAQIPNAAGGTDAVTVGLVGMHIAHKSQSSPQWIWATFEQVDNLVGDALAHPPIQPSFYNPNCPLCLPNQNPNTTGDTTTPTQAVRAIQVTGEKVRLNEEAQAVLAKLGSVWRFYRLIDTQWPTEPGIAAADWNGGLPSAVENKPGGDPTPVFLTNITMETYFQTGVQAACKQEEVPSGIVCPPTKPARFGFKSADNARIFATESCMGCHSSAGLTKTYDPATKHGTTWPPLSADFSWLPQLKAAYEAAQ